MATITFKGAPVHTVGELPGKGASAPDFVLVGLGLEEVQLSGYAGKKKVLNIFPSVDTGICAASVRRFNSEAADLKGVAVLNISADLPFAHKRFCGAEGIENTHSLSTFRGTFARDYGVEMLDGPLKGLCSRAVVVLDADNVVLYTEQVREVVQEPDYAAALAALR